MLIKEKQQDTFQVDEKGRFILEEYHRRKTFSSFLPGIAGTEGIPLWAFYVNRGQGISSFGTRDKSGAILEFFPANQAYRHTPRLGFRTFFRLYREGEWQFYEPFTPPSCEGRRRMGVSPSEFYVEEETDLLKIKVLYHTLPEAPFAGLIRTVTVTNVSGDTLGGEILDGLPAIIPSGVEHSTMKEMSQTAMAWMEARREGPFVFYAVNAAVEDEAEVQRVESANFVTSLFQEGEEWKTPFYYFSPDEIFGMDETFSVPENFLHRGLDGLPFEDSSRNRQPCAFSGTRYELAPEASFSLVTLLGYTGDKAGLKSWINQVTDPGWYDFKRKRNRHLIKDVSEHLACCTGNTLFDAYAGQTYLDNVIRGGYPVSIGSHLFYVYQRRHGDLERDYNYFFLSPEKYSHGLGNYRDVNQNRRCDSFLYPHVGEYNIRYFVSLLQPDGYNPLSSDGVVFRLNLKGRELLSPLTSRPAEAKELLSAPFTPGDLLTRLQHRGILLEIPEEEFLSLALDNADREIVAEFQEGYWIDHWTYNLDLIDDYLSLYPEKEEELFFASQDYLFAESPYRVEPRSRRHVLTDKGVRQYKGPVLCEKMRDRQSRYTSHKGFSRDQKGNLLASSLFEKLLLLGVLKTATLDPSGLGIEMEAGRPGWYDALNGLPGLLGSSVSETAELVRLLRRLLRLCSTYSGRAISLYEEIFQLTRDIVGVCLENTGSNDSFRYWEETNRFKEGYRNRVYENGFSGVKQECTLESLKPLLAALEKHVAGAMEKARTNDGIDGCSPTFFRHEARDWSLLGGNDGEGRPYVEVKRFEKLPLPLFLEGQVKALKLADTPLEALMIHRRVKESDLYDRKLGMYRVNGDLSEQDVEIGRCRSFPSGWLENGSIWLHMEYKYLLELLRAGLAREFWQEARTCFPFFMEPDQYGRSPLENSSFIVSSSYFDESLHGRGFVARLSGAAAEFISIWHALFLGPMPFRLTGSGLWFDPQPALPEDLFKQDGTLSFRFREKTTIVYRKASPGDLFFDGTWRMTSLVLRRGSLLEELAAEELTSERAVQIRDGRFEEITVNWEKNT